MRAAHALHRQAQAGTLRIPTDVSPLPNDPRLQQAQGQAGDRGPRRRSAQDSGRPPAPPGPGLRPPSQWPERAEPRPEEQHEAALSRCGRPGGKRPEEGRLRRGAGGDRRGAALPWALHSPGCHTPS